MTKVIALQETQLGNEGLKGAYMAGKTMTNNANVISSIGETPAPTTPVAEPINNPASVTPVNIDMEGTPVNLNSVVNPNVTSEVFGPAIPSAPQVNAAPTNDEAVNTFAQPAGTANMFNQPGSSIADTVAPNSVQSSVTDAVPNMFDNTPVATPVTSTPVTNGGESSVSEDLTSLINILRNKIDTYASEMHAELDKIQESLNKGQTSPKVEPAQGPVVTPVNDVPSGNMFDVAQPPQPESAMQNPSASDLIGNNLDETMVIPRDVMTEAITQDNALKMAA